MVEQLSAVRLKGGEEVESAVITGPDAAWRERLESLLSGKDDIWKWQVDQMLSRELGIEARFYVLHRGGEPFAHILTACLRGVGSLGHVWTEPQDRGKGAASKLTDLVVGDFKARGGQALYLSTGYNSPAFHIYGKSGFVGLEPKSGTMHLFTTTASSFETEYFAPGETVIEPLGWQHWATAPALFCGDWPEQVRSTPLGMLGRRISEKPLLAPLYERRQDATQPATTLALRKTENDAVVGLAAWRYDPTWPETVLVDVFCHPQFSDRAPKLLEELSLPTNLCALAYADVADARKQEVLSAAGFQQVTTLPNWIDADIARTRSIDVTVFRREPVAVSC